MSRLLTFLAPALPVILLLGVALRLIWMLLIPVEPVSDPGAYLIFATNIHEYGVYGFTPDEPGAYWAVGPAALYAWMFDIFGNETFLGVLVINMISSILVMICLWDLGRRWYSEEAGRIAALVFAIWPLTIQYTTVLASELHFMALVLMGLSFWDRARAQTGAGAAAGLGPALLALALSALAFAAATYMRPIALLIPAALAIAALLHRPRLALPEIIKAVVVIALIFAAVSPWSARNERIYGEPVFMSTNFWANFWMGNHPGTNGEYAPLPAETDQMSDLEREAYLEGLALEYIRTEPGAFLTRTLRKALRLHQRETVGVAWNAGPIERRFGAIAPDALRLVSTGYWYLMLLGGLAGIVVSARTRGAWTTLLSPPVWLWLYFTALHAIIVVGDRYHMPAIPMIALLCGLALSQLERNQNRS